MKKHHIPTEHYYIPLGLFLLNCGLIHFLCLLSAGNLYAAGYKAITGAALLFLIFSVGWKKRQLILPASLFYLLCLLYPLLFF